MKKKHSLLRLGAVVLTLALLLGSGTMLASAADYREQRPDRQAPAMPQWQEKTVTCQSGDNTLRGTLTLPKTSGAQVPVAILLHGLSTDKSWCDDIAWTLADHGIASVRFDFAGTGDSDGVQEDMTVSSEIQDTLAILDYVESQVYTDRDNIFLVGKSMGGVDAVLAAQGREDEIKAMCLWYPGFGITEATRQGFLLGQNFDPLDPPETLEAGGYTYGRAFLLETQRLNIKGACASYDGPVLILHGDRDYIAPLIFSQEAEQVFPDCTLRVVPGGSHGFWGYQETQALNDMVEFFTALIAES
jgi:hypothetical protein